MSCQKNYCPNKLTVCCKDCIRNATDFCETVCEGAGQDSCKNYRDEDRERKKRKEDRTMIRCLAAILILVLLLFGAALLQAWWVSARDTGTEATKKEPPAATERLQPVKTGQIKHSQHTRSGKETQDDK